MSSARQLYVAPSAGAPQVIKREVDVLFEAIDVKGTGIIDRAALAAFMAQQGYQPEDADSLFTLMDVNSDGELSKEDLARGFGLTLEYEHAKAATTIHMMM